jgi:predicted DNA-binding transcriptional regulator AlpA
MRSKTPTAWHGSGADGSGPNLPGSRPVKLIFKPEVLRRVPLSYTTIWKRMRANQFPRARILGGKNAWVEHEVDDFIAALPVRPYKAEEVAPNAEPKKQDR